MQSNTQKVNSPGMDDVALLFTFTEQVMASGLFKKISELDTVRNSLVNISRILEDNHTNIQNLQMQINALKVPVKKSRR